MSMEKKELTCIRCPMGCQITVTLENGQVTDITGNTCPRGAEYAANEVTHPVRTVTSTAKVIGGVLPVIPVKTKTDVPKEKMMDVMSAIARIEAKAPVAIGDVLLRNAAGTGADIVAARDVEATD